jgi:hypothetical protein
MVAESWFLLMIVVRHGESVHVRLPMEGFEECMAEGERAESVAAKLKGVKVNWACETSQ